MDKGIYYRLKWRLHNIPGGYPDAPNGIGIKILKRRFTPEEARRWRIL